MNPLTNHIKASRTYPVAIAILAVLFLVIAFGGSSAKAYPSGAHLYSDTWAGQPSGLLSSPYDAAYDPATNRVYVADTGNNRVQVFTPDGTYVNQFGNYGTGNGEFSAPRGIDVNDGQVFVADSTNHRIQVFTTAGQYLYKFGTQGSGGTQFQTPLGVSVAGAGGSRTIYVADTNNHRLSIWAEVCSPNCNSATPITVYGSGNGSANGQFSQPFGVDVEFVDDPVSDCGYKAVAYVADYGNSRVQKLQSGGSPICFLPSVVNSYVTKWAIGGQPYKTKIGPGGNIYTVASVGTPVTVNTNTGTPVTTWGSGGTGDGQFRFARGLATSSSQVFVADGSNNRIQRFSSTGTYQTKWGVSSNNPGEFNGPNSVATDSSGNIYVADTNNDRIQKFAPSGKFLMQWGGSGTGDGQFNNPLGVAVSPDDTVWVADTNNNRVQKFNTSGVFQSKFGSTGNGNGQFNGPRALAFIGSAVYVVDGGNNRVQAFQQATNAFSLAFGSAGGGNGQFNFVNSIASAGGYVYVSDNTRIQVFNYLGGFQNSVSVPGGPTGLSWVADELYVAKATTGSIAVYVAQVNTTDVVLPYVACVTGDGYGELSNPQGVWATGTGGLFVADQGNNRVSKLSVSGVHLFPNDPTTCDTRGQIGNSQFASPRGIAASPAGEIYVADTGNYRIARYTATGQTVARWGMSDQANGFNVALNGVAIAPNGVVATVDSQRIRRFDQVGDIINSVATPGPQATDVTVGPGGDLYRLTGTTVTRYDSATLGVLNTWGSAGSGNSQFSSASGITTDSAGNVYVADYGNDRIQKFTSTGTYVSQWSTTDPRDVAIGPNDDRTFVLSSTGVTSYSPTGSMIEKFGSAGTGVGQFTNPLGIAVTSTGRVAVSDTGANRVQLLNFTNSRTLYDSKITDYGGNELTVPAIPATTVTGGF